jgi:hypothetical protein
LQGIKIGKEKTQWFLISEEFRSEWEGQNKLKLMINYSRKIQRGPWEKLVPSY